MVHRQAVRDTECVACIIGKHDVNIHLLPPGIFCLTYVTMLVKCDEHKAGYRNRYND